MRKITVFSHTFHDIKIQVISRSFFIPMTIVQCITNIESKFWRTCFFIVHFWTIIYKVTYFRLKIKKKCCENFVKTNSTINQFEKVKCSYAVKKLSHLFNTFSRCFQKSQFYRKLQRGNYICIIKHFFDEIAFTCYQCHELRNQMFIIYQKNLLLYSGSLFQF